jgi:hypothetical protein
VTITKYIKHFDLRTLITFISIIGLLFFGFSFISIDLTSREIYITPLLDYQVYVKSDYYSKINPPLLEVSLLRIDQIFQIIFLILIFMKKKFSDKKELYSLCILALISFIPIFSNDFFSYLNHFKGLIQTIILIYFLKNFPLIFNSCDLRKLFNWLSFFGIILCIYGLYQLIAFQFISSDYSNVSKLPLVKFYFNNPSLYGPSAVVFSDGIFRVFSIFKEPSNFAFVLNSLILLRYSKFKENFFRDFYFIIFLIFILLSQSYFNIFFLIIFIFYAVSNRLKIILLLISFACIFFIPRMSGIILSLIQICSYYLGFNTDLKLNDPSFDYRFDKILIGVKIFLDFPLFGIGLNNLATYTETFRHVLQSMYETKLYVLNMYTLQHLVELGIISTIYLYSIVFKIVKSKYFNKYVICFIFFNIFYQDLPFFSPLRIFSLALMAIVYSNQKKQTI